MKNQEQIKQVIEGIEYINNQIATRIKKVVDTWNEEAEIINDMTCSRGALLNELKELKMRFKVGDLVKDDTGNIYRITRVRASCHGNLLKPDNDSYYRSFSDKIKLKEVSCDLSDEVDADNCVSQAYYGILLYKSSLIERWKQPRFLYGKLEPFTQKETLL